MQDSDQVRFSNTFKRWQRTEPDYQKGSHFSILGGAVKKELEKSTQALDAANLDLSKKIEENGKWKWYMLTGWWTQKCIERLHEELSEVNHIYTDHVKGLHTQIADLEKRVEELQVENSTSQKDRRDQTMTLKQEKADLQAQLEQLKREYSE